MAENQALALATIMSEQPGTMMCTIQPEPGNREQAKVIYNAMNNPQFKVSDYINKKITVENFLVEIQDIINEGTGEYDRVPRIVLISPEGESYVAVSKGIFNSIRNAYQAFGPAPWKGGITFEVKQLQVKNGSMLTLDIV